MLYADGVSNRTIKAYDNEVENVTLTYFDLGGAKYDGNKVNENMGNIVGRLGRSSEACILPVVENNTETDVTCGSLNTWTDNGVVYTEDTKTGTKTLKKVTSDYEGTEFVVPNDVDVLTAGAFTGTSIKNVSIPASVTNFGCYQYTATNAYSSAFKDSSVETIVLAEGMTEIPNAAFSGATNLKSVNIPSSVKAIGIWAFRSTALTSLEIPATVEELGYGAFRDMNELTTVTINGDVYIPDYAFRACAKLTTVRVNGLDVTFGTNMVFTNTSTNNENPNNITVYVNNASIQKRLADTKDFKGSIVCTNTSDENGIYTDNSTGDTYAYAGDTDSLEKAIANGADTVYVDAGNYTFPADTTIGEGDTIVCADGTVFEGTSSLNVNGATVIGGTFSNPSGSAVSQSVNGTFKDCTFTGYNGLRYCYAGDTVVFENCVFDGSVYGVHFDGGANNVIFRNCTMSGFNTMGSAITQLTMEGCTFVANGKSGYNGINLWGSTEMKDCTFVFDGTAGTEWVHARGTNKTYTITNCVVTDGTNVKSIANEFYDNGTGNTVIIDGAQVVYTSDALKAAIESKASKVLLADGDYSLTFTNNTAFNADGMTIIGNGDNVKLSITSSEVWYGRVQGNNVTFENIHFTSSVGATGKATYNECTFDTWAICASSNNAETYYNDCTINGCLNTSTDFSSGNIFLNGCDVVKAEYSGAAAMNFEDCTIGELISWDMTTVLTGCTVTTLVTEHMSSNTITVDGTVVAP